MQMHSSLTFGFEMDDRLGTLVWRAIVMRSLARTGEGLVVCDGDLGVLFATMRAVHLLGRLGMAPDRALPDPVAKLVNEQMAASDPLRCERLPALKGAGAVHIRAEVLEGIPGPARVAIFLRGEVLRDEALYAVLREHFNVSRRGFQLAQLLRQGLTNREIAKQANLTEATVKVYLHQLYRECGVSSRTALLAVIDRLAR
jgi:DNA-binding CsgD family transcriptional regulator